MKFPLTPLYLILHCGHDSTCLRIVLSSQRWSPLPSFLPDEQHRIPNNETTMPLEGAAC